MKHEEYAFHRFHNNILGIVSENEDPRKTHAGPGLRLGLSCVL